MEDNLAKSLLLATLLYTENLIDLKELTLIKKFFLGRQDNRKSLQILAAFKKSKNLFSLRSELRGHMGLPRMRASDNNFKKPETRRQVSKSLSIPVKSITSLNILDLNTKISGPDCLSEFHQASDTLPTFRPAETLGQSFLTREDDRMSYNYSTSAQRISNKSHPL